MATNKYLDWSRPIISGFEFGFNLAQEKKEARKKDDWKMFLSGVTLMKSKQPLPEGLSDFMNNYMEKNYGVQANFESYVPEDKTKTLRLDDAEGIIKNAQSVYGQPFLGKEKDLAKFINDNTTENGNFKMSKDDLEGYLDTYYSNLLKTQGDVKKQQEAAKKEVRTFKNSIKKKELTDLITAKTKLDKVDGMIQQLKTLYYEAYDPISVKKGDVIGGVGARLRGKGKGLAGFLGANPQARVYKDLSQAISSLLAKGVWGEAGRLTDQDIVRALGALGSETNTKQEADAKFNLLTSLSKKAMTNFNNRWKVLTGAPYNENIAYEAQVNLTPYEMEDIDMEEEENSFTRPLYQLRPEAAIEEDVEVEKEPESAIAVNQFSDINF